ncbi:MAG: cytochrome P450 [Nocardioides sp.]
MISPLKGAVRTVLLRLATRGTGVPDLTQLKKVPEHLTYPLRRDGMDPLPQMAHQRSEDPVTKLGSVLGLDIWLVTGHAETKKVLADTTSYSNDIRHLLGKKKRDGADEVGGLGMTDPPDHTRLRGLITPEFTMRRLKRLEATIDEVIATSLDKMEAHGPVVDMVEDFGFEIPFRVICDLLGLPEDTRDEFHHLGVARFDVSKGGPGVFGSAAETRTFLINAVKEQRDDPGEGLIGEILRTHGADFDDVELGGLADGVFLGGYETSAAMLSMGALVLAQNPVAYADLRSGSPKKVNAVVEELLRYLCPVQVAFPRFAKQDLDLFGHTVTKGSVVIASLVGANRDPEAVPHPEQFDLRNASTQHFAFGHGMHRCVGAELARMEMRASLVALSNRFPDLTLDSTDYDDFGFRDLSIVYGLDRLPVRIHG